jgi:two-component system nitrate/nitrite response regulator NarL
VSAETIRVAIVEDDTATRHGLASLIGGEPGFECIWHCASVEDALDRLADSPEVLLLDIGLPGIPGSEGVRIFRDRSPNMQVVMLTVFDDADRVFQSICNGACGYLLKKTAPKELLEAIQQAHHGGAPMTPEIARKVITLFRQTAPPPRKAEHGLSSRELEVLTLLAEGYGYVNIAARLEITINTIRNHIRSIYEKLHVNTSSEAVSKAIRGRII